MKIYLVDQPVFYGEEIQKTSWATYTVKAFFSRYEAERRATELHKAEVDWQIQENGLRNFADVKCPFGKLFEKALERKYAELLSELVSAEEARSAVDEIVDVEESAQLHPLLPHEFEDVLQKMDLEFYSVREIEVNGSMREAAEGLLAETETVSSPQDDSGTASQ